MPTFTTDFRRANLVARAMTGAGARLGWDPAKALANAMLWQGWVDAAPGPANRAAREELASDLQAEVQTIDFAALTPEQVEALTTAAEWCVLIIPDPVP